MWQVTKKKSWELGERGHMFKWLKGQQAQPAQSMILNPEGVEEQQLTPEALRCADMDAVHEQVMREWLRFFRRHDNEPRKSWKAFIERFGHAIPRRREHIIREISGTDLLQVVKEWN